MKKVFSPCLPLPYDRQMTNISLLPTPVSLACMSPSTPPNRFSNRNYYWLLKPRTLGLCRLNKAFPPCNISSKHVFLRSFSICRKGLWILTQFCPTMMSRWGLSGALIAVAFNANWSRKTQLSTIIGGPVYQVFWQTVWLVTVPFKSKDRRKMK